MTNCAQYQYWLENQSVLDTADARELERHLTVCPECRQVSQAMLQYEAGILALRRITHSTTIESAVDKILGAAKMTSRVRVRGAGFQLEPVMNFLTEPVIRYVTGILIVLILALFAFQEAVNHRQLSGLAQRLQVQSGQKYQVKSFIDDLNRWRQDLVLPDALRPPTEQTLKQYLIRTDANRIPIIWRFRYGKNSQQVFEKLWRQQMR
ncbi:MAG: zf-HC2 domain-containing protein [Lentisphaeria bacterium]|nr:zf-HC2 domain-containing protein [Candidatus Neomarinimicrobiota bacterium]MCF7841768.1 zf-HC2 domain-containing protein [Lentisphaeria bacterium]